jgi:chromosome segregation ATPase
MSDGHLYTPQNDPNGDFSFVDDSNITEEDRKEILEQIDHVVETNRIPVTGEMFRIKAQRGGGLFPLLMNIILLALAAGGIFYAFRYFETRQATMSEETQAYLSTEGRLIEEMRRESEARLRQKEQEISRIRQELDALDQQSRELQESIEERIQNREAELRARLEAELEEERTRLQAQGISQEDISERLDILEQQRLDEAQDELDQFRAEAQAELRQKEQELAEARTLAEEILEEASAEREQLQEEALEREEELRAQFEAEREALETRSTEVEERLQELTALRERESLVNDQITGAYTSVIERIREGEIDAALTELDNLREFLNSPNIQTLPAVADRRGVELFIIENLRENLQAQAAPAETGDASLLDAANLVVNAREIVGRGNAAREEGRLQEAERIYTRALEAIPAMNQAYTALRSLEENRTAGAIRGRIEAAEELLSGGETEEALEEFRQAAVMSAGPRSNLAEEAVSGVETVLRRSAAAEREALESELDGELRSAVASREERITALQADLTEARQNLAEARENLEESRARVSALTEETETEEEAVTELQDRVDELQEELRLARAAAATRPEPFEATPEEVDAAVENAREEAYGTVLDYLGFVSGTESDRIRTQLEEQAEEDRLFRSVVDRLQGILEAGAEEARLIQVEETKLIGTVSSVTSGRVVIEPLVTIPIAEGNTVIIKRRTATGEVPVATGSVYDVSAGRIAANLGSRLSTERSPMVMDLVYMEVEE